jgi:26S proteasome regulatory subunit N1
MPPSKRPFLADEELGKKDDDHRPEKLPDQQWQPKAWKPPRRRRILIVLIILYLLYIFFKNMPTDIPTVRERFKSRLPPSQHAMPDAPLPPVISQSDPPPRDESDIGHNDDLYYKGELKFYNLGRTLKLFDMSAGQRGKNPSKATVFAAASLGSVTDLLPLACRMASQKLNEVHFVLMGRDDISPEGIQRVNGVDKANCPVYWHGELVLLNRKLTK